MQQSPYFNNMLSPAESSKFFPSFQHFNNNLCSPRTLFFGLSLNSSGQNSYNKKFILSKMKFSSSGGKNFLSNKRNYNSESIEKNNTKKNLINNNSKINSISNSKEKKVPTTILINETKASSKKNNSTYLGPNTSVGIGEKNNYFNYNYYQYNNQYNNYNFNKSAYIGSVKKNLLPSLSNELKSNTKNKINKKQNHLNNTSNKKSSNKSIAYEHLCKTAENLDLEKMVDYIVSSTKVYNRYNDNKENYFLNNNFNSLINKNENSDVNNINSSGKKSKKKLDEINNNDDLQKNNNSCSLCKCKKVECLKYSCSCLKSGNKCNNLCTCTNCKNKENNIFKINS